MAAAQKVSEEQIAEYALGLGDDALILGQRLCEWCTAAPVLEEDIAIANVGSDYFGRARMLLQYAGKTLGKSEDELAFLRDVDGFKNLLIVELPRGDFAYSMVRQYLFDEFELLFFEALRCSKDEILAAIAEKTIKEARYHQRRSAEWIRRLGLGTPESRRRTQGALDGIWPYVAELFEMEASETQLFEAGIAVDRHALAMPWEDKVLPFIEEVGLKVPNKNSTISGGRKGIHSEAMKTMLVEMQVLQREHPGLDW